MSNDRAGITKIFITGQRIYTKDHDHTAFSVIRIGTLLVGQLGGRNTWLTITNNDFIADKANPSIKGVIYRQVRGLSIPHSACQLDYDGIQDLGIKSVKVGKDLKIISTSKTDESIDEESKDETPYFPCNLQVEKTIGIHGHWMAHWGHPNSGYRIPMQIALIGLALGVFGFLIAIPNVVSSALILSILAYVIVWTFLYPRHPDALFLRSIASRTLKALVKSLKEIFKPWK